MWYPDTFRHSGLLGPCQGGSSARSPCALRGHLATFPSHPPAPCLCPRQGSCCPEEGGPFLVGMECHWPPQPCAHRLCLPRGAPSPNPTGPRGSGQPVWAGSRPRQGPCSLLSAFPAAHAKPCTQLVLNRDTWKGGEKVAGKEEGTEE